jgi:hypothetical protein
MLVSEPKQSVTSLFDQFVLSTQTDDCPKALSDLLKVRSAIKSDSGKAEFDELIHNCKASTDATSKYKLAWAGYFKSTEDSNGKTSLPMNTPGQKADKSYQESVKAFDAYLLQSPGDVRARCYRDFVQGEFTGDFDSAVKSWQRMAQENPSCKLPKRLLLMLELSY